MNIKSLLLGSAAALLAVSGARAADAPIVAEPEPVEFVRVCDAYGAGYFYIPGTETCMRISGYVRSEIQGGDNTSARMRGELRRDTYAWRTRATLQSHTASETELGTLRTFFELRSQWDGGAEFADAGDSANGQLRFAFIELGGLRVGLDESIFNHWTGYFGNVMNDDVLTPMSGSRTNVISYTFNSGNGFSAILGFEQGNKEGDTWGFRYDSHGNRVPHKLSQQMDDYTPNIVGGLKFVQGWGGVSAVAAYDAYNSEWAGKVRLDVNLSEQFSLWAMGGYKSMKDYYNDDETYGVRNIRPGYLRNGIYRQINSIYGDWGGAWAVWGGGTYKFTPQTSFNFQLAYEEARTFTSSVNVSHELVPGLTITPELTYTNWDNKYGYKHSNGLGDERISLKSKDALQGMIRLQRSF